MTNRFTKCEMIEHAMQFSMIAHTVSTLSNIYPDITTQFQFENVSVPFAKMKETTKMTANNCPIHSNGDLD